MKINLFINNLIKTIYLYLNYTILANNLMDCTGGEVLISADHKGIIKVFINKFKPETE